MSAFCDSEPFCAEARDERDRFREENERLRKALNTACGYLLNAKIDLETGAPKRTAIQTIDGGLRAIRAHTTEADQ